MSTIRSHSADAQASRKHRLLAVAAAVGLAVAGYVVENVSALVGIVAFDVDPGAPALLVLVSIAAGKPLVLGCSYAYLRVRSLPFSVSLPSRDEARLTGGIVVVSVVAGVVLNLARARLVDGETTSILGQVIAENPTFALVLGVLSLALIAPAEEFLYRGVVQRRFGVAFGTTASIVGASALFGAYHFLNFQGPLLGRLLTLAIIGAVSLLWGYGCERTDNFAVPVLAHGLYNFTLLVVAYVRL